MLIWPSGARVNRAPNENRVGFVTCWCFAAMMGMVLCRTRSWCEGRCNARFNPSPNPPSNLPSDPLEGFTPSDHPVSPPPPGPANSLVDPVSAFSLFGSFAYSAASASRTSDTLP